MCSHTVLGACILGAGVVFIALGAGIGWGVIPNVVENEIAATVQLTNGSDAWDMWVEIPIPILFKVYFFVVTNPNAVMDGKKPILEERGPYTYEQKRVKYDIKLEDNGKNASYYQHITMTFSANLSGPGLLEKDKITLVNAPLMGAILTADIEYQEEGSIHDGALKILNTAIPYAFGGGAEVTSIFATHTVKEWLIDGIKIDCPGAKDVITVPAADLAQWKAFCVATDRANVDAVIRDDENGEDFLFSFLWKKNFTNDGRYKVDTGVEEPRNLGWIYEWNESPALPFWSGPKCNEVKGTDGAIFPPFLSTESILPVFSTDICRSLYVQYERETSYKGIPGLRFVATSDQLETPLVDPDNYCWCGKHAACLQRGAVDLFPCQKSPAVLTWPHFFQGPQQYLDAVSGLEPDADSHQTFAELEPYTGVPLRGSKRVQMNMMLKKVRNIPLTETLPELLLPMLWFDEGTDLPDKYVKMIEDDLIHPMNLAEGFRWTLIALGITGFLVGSGILFVCWLIA